MPKCYGANPTALVIGLAILNALSKSVAHIAVFAFRTSRNSRNPQQNVRKPALRIGESLRDLKPGIGG
jgi:hypothetical protein